MKTLIFIGAVVAVLAMFLLYRVFKSGYRGAIGFKNRHASEISTLSLTGFPTVVECRTLALGEHSFNYLGPQAIPDEVTITWRFVIDTTDRTARVSLAGVTKDAKDGEAPGPSSTRHNCAGKVTARRMRTMRCSYARPFH